jgi:microcin C transport system substrate-binding protein
MKRIAIFFLILGVVPAFADQLYPPSDWKDQPNPIASPYAVPGGEVAIYAGPSPKSLNYYLDNNTFTSQVFGSMYETLLSFDSVTLEYRPGIAASWSISDDKQTFTFYLDPRARWSDGTPITASDAKWTFDAIMDPKNLTGVHKVSLERFQSPVVIDDHTIRFHAKEPHWVNLLAASSFNILPQKAFEHRDFNKINFEFSVVSGPYRIGRIEEGIFMTLERRSDWWGWQLQSARHTSNFQTLKFIYFEERENAFEAFKKGLIDLFPVYTSRIWVNETTGEKFENNWIARQKIYNHHPVGFQGFAMNMRKPPFNDIRVRKAMALLLNRELMNQTLMYGQYFLQRSYFEDLYSKANPCPNPLTPFDPQAAGRLLAEAGWHADPATGFLEKAGHRFSFRFLSRDASMNKFLAIYAEDLKNAGIEMIIDQKDWAAWAKDMDQFNYQMTWAAWGASVFHDPEGMWSSKEADRISGNNITGFKNARVDALIEKQKTIFEIGKRNDIYRQIDQLIFNEYPYVLLWNIDYVRLLYWNKFGTPPWVLSKYDNEQSAYSLWWNDPDAMTDLNAAMQENSPLPGKPDEIHFDQLFERLGTRTKKAQSR